MSYDEVRSDFEKLEEIKECDDWAWVEEELTNFLQNPNKKKAASMYESLIMQWLSENERNSENGWAYDKYA